MPYADAERRRENARNYYHTKKKPQDKERTILISTRLPETIVGRLSQIASDGNLTGKYPWKSLTQTVRAMVLLGLKKMAEDGDFESKDMVDILELTKSYSAIASVRRQCQSMLETAKSEINALQEINAHDAAIHMYANTIEAIEELTISEWTRWLAKEMKAMYPEMERKRVRGEVPSTSLKTRAGRKLDRDRANRGLRMIDQHQKKKKR